MVAISFNQFFCAKNLDGMVNLKNLHFWYTLPERLQLRSDASWQVSANLVIEVSGNVVNLNRNKNDIS